jgi:hypothetical protein
MRQSVKIRRHMGRAIYLVDVDILAETNRSRLPSADQGKRLVYRR